MSMLIELQVGVILAASSPISTYPQQVEKVGIGRAVEVAPSNDPALQAAAARTRGTLGLERQAGLRPNPSFNFDTENIRFFPGFSLSM